MPFRSAVRRAARPVAAALLVPCVAAPAGAQLAGVPVLQGAFARPGLALGVNAGTGDDGSAVGAAVAWGLADGRFALSAGAAAFSPPEPYRSPSLTYGARLGWNVLSFAGGAVGVTPFAGVGRAELRRDAERRDGDAGNAGMLRARRRERRLPARARQSRRGLPVRGADVRLHAPG